MTLETEAFS